MIGCAGLFGAPYSHIVFFLYFCAIIKILCQKSIKAQQLVKEWLGLHYEELVEMWNTQKMGKITPL